MMIGMLALPASIAAAQPPLVTHVVYSTADEGPGSLRAALEAAARTPGSDRVEFGDADGPFSTPRTIELASPLPPVNGEVTIDGHIRNLLWSAYGATVSGGGKHRLFEVEPGATLRLRGITLSDGRAETGGAVLNRGRLVVEGVSLLRNRADRAGGAIANDGGTVLMINTTAADNRAERGGAVANLDGDLRVTNSTLYRNEAAEGAAVYSSARLEMANSILAGDGPQCVNAGPLGEGTTHNLITASRGCGEPLLVTDPLLGPFGYYNGPTPVFTIGGGSPVINIGSNAAAVDEHGKPLTWDQRGNGDPRFAAGYTDLGAFEQQAPVAAEFVVDTLADSGLRGCSPVVAGDCPLRAALELAAAARQPAPVRFDPAVFGKPATIRLDATVHQPDTPVLLDGKGSAGVTLILQRAAPGWRAVNGVSLLLKDPTVGG